MAGTGRVALLWRGDREARANATPENNRYNLIFEELAARGIHAEPAVYSDDMVDEVRAQLLRLDGVLVWVNPISDGQNRHRLDAMLRDVASRGVWVSAHPDVILKMGVKEVLYRTRHLGWGTDTHLYRVRRGSREEFPRRLRVGRSARAQAEPGQWRPGHLEGRTRSPSAAAWSACCEARRGSVPEDIPLADSWRAATSTSWRRLHRRPAVPAAAARRHDPLLHGCGQGRRLRPPADQGADPAAARGAGFASRATRPAHHAPGIGPAVPAPCGH